MAIDKTFYIETFGCPMHAHNSEMVIGILVRLTSMLYGNLQFSAPAPDNLELIPLSPRYSITPAGALRKKVVNMRKAMTAIIASHLSTHLPLSCRFSTSIVAASL
jgi:hypothetical protein